MKRRSLTPSPFEAGAQRRTSVRRPFSERVVFRREEAEVRGWALNISRGGLRAILDEPVELGASFEVTLGDQGARCGQVVWIQEEPDGAIVGVAFADADADATNAADSGLTFPPEVASLRAGPNCPGGPERSEDADAGRSKESVDRRRVRGVPHAR